MLTGQNADLFGNTVQKLISVKMYHIVTPFSVQSVLGVKL